MVTRMFSWLAGLALVLVFMVVISPDLFRGYVFSQDTRSPGKKTYDTYCVGCHGPEGLGNGPAAEFLLVKPRNFVNGDFKFFHFGEPPPFPSDESLKLTVRNGLPGAAMSGFPLLTDQEIQDVVEYVKSLREGGWNTPAPIQAASEPVPIEGTTAEELFANAGCNGCHQLDALGSVGGVGPNLSQVGSRLSKDQIVQSIMDPNAVIAENCPAGPCLPNVMIQNFSQRLSAEQIDALAEYLSQQN